MKQQLLFDIIFQPSIFMTGNFFTVTVGFIQIVGIWKQSFFKYQNIYMLPLSCREDIWITELRRILASTIYSSKKNNVMEENCEWKYCLSDMMLYWQ
jgi:hypothetical protein